MALSTMVPCYLRWLEAIGDYCQQDSRHQVTLTGHMVYNWPSQLGAHRTQLAGYHREAPRIDQNGNKST